MCLVLGQLPGLLQDRDLGRDGLQHLLREATFWVRGDAGVVLVLLDHGPAVVYGLQGGEPDGLGLDVDQEGNQLGDRRVAVLAGAGVSPFLYPLSVAAIRATGLDMRDQ